MEYTQWNHWSSFHLTSDLSKQVDRTFEKVTRKVFPITYTGDNMEKLIVDFKGQICWINKGELDALNSVGLTIESPMIFAYVEGMFGPWVNDGGKIVPIDGYEFHVMYN
jgi:hypothetical protein